MPREATESQYCRTGQPTQTGPSGPFLSPPQIAKRLGISPDRVISMIRRGELKGVNVGEPGKTRARYRVAPEWLQDWIDGRVVVKPDPKPARRRPATLPKNITKYY